jgi:hypothetical protein
MAVPYIFSNVPGGTSIPLSELDANFAYLTTSPSLTNLTLTGNLAVGGSATFTGNVTTNNLDVNGSLTVGGTTVNPTGATGTGALVFNNGPTLIAPVLGTPASGNLTNCTGYPINQIAGLATGVLPFLTNPSSANLAAAVVDETGTGNLVLSNNPTLTSPTLVAPILGTPASGNLSACTGYPAPNLSGVVPVVNGGTGLSATGAVGEVLGVSAPGVLGYFAAPPSANIAGGAASQLLYQAAPNTTAFVPNGTIGQPLVSNGAAPPAWGQISLTAAVTGALPIANGGTNSTTQQAAINTLVASTTAGTYLRGNGTNVVMSAIQISDIPTLNQNTTGSAATFTSTTQNSQFNSIGVGVAASSVPGQINASANVVTAGRFVDPSGTLYPIVPINDAALSGNVFPLTGIPSWATLITIMLKGVSASGFSDLGIQLGTSGGVTAVGYAAGAWVYNTGASNSTYAHLTAGGISGYTGMVTIARNPGTLIYSISGLGTRGDTAPYIANSYVTLPSVLTSFQVILSNAQTFSGGTVSAYFQ